MIYSVVRVWKWYSRDPEFDWENNKYLDRILYLTTPWEAGLTKIWAWGTGFFGLFVGNLGNSHNPNKCLAAKPAGVSFQTKL